MPAVKQPCFKALRSEIQGPGPGCTDDHNFGKAKSGTKLPGDLRSHQLLQLGIFFRKESQFLAKK